MFDIRQELLQLALDLSDLTDHLGTSSHEAGEDVMRHSRFRILEQVPYH